MRLESNTGTKTITMRGQIGDFDNCISANDFRDCLNEHAGNDVVINLDSEGGVVSEGLAIYNAIAQHDGDVTIHIDTIAASIATVIASAASKVIINSNAKYMIHRCWTVAMGNCNDFKSTAKVMEMMDEDIAATYVEKTGKGKEEVLAMMDDETWMTADEAVSHGFADEVNVINKKARAEVKPSDVVALCPFIISAKAKSTARRMKMRIKKS